MQRSVQYAQAARNEGQSERDKLSLISEGQQMLARDELTQVPSQFFIQIMRNEDCAFPGARSRLAAAFRVGLVA